MQANGVRYQRVGGTRECHFDGTSFEPRNLPENAATPTRRVHALLVFAQSYDSILDYQNKPYS